MKILLLTVLIILTVSELFSQGEYLPGYYINNSGDTISGYILNKGDIGNSQNCIYKETEKDQAEAFKPGEIQAYSISGFRYYQSMELPVEGQKVIVFAEYLVDGIADFYYFRNINGNHFYMVSDKTELIELPPAYTRPSANKKLGPKEFEVNKYSGIIKYAMSDQPALYKKIDKLTLQKKDLIEIADNYHELACKDGSECITFSTELKERNSGIYLDAKLSSVFLTTRVDYYDLTDNVVNGISKGLGINWFTSVPNLNKHFFLSTGFDISIFQNNSLVQQQDFLNYSREIELKMKTVWISPGLEMRWDFLPMAKISPYLAAGYSSDISLYNQQSRMEILYMHNLGTVETDYLVSPIINSNYSGFQIGIGSYLSILSFHDFGINMEYSRKTGITPVEWPAKFDSYTIKLGYYY